MKPQKKPKGDPIGFEPEMPEDAEDRIMRLVEALGGAPADLDEVRLHQCRLILPYAVIIREYDRVDADTIGGHTVTAEYVVEERGDEISDIVSYYNGQCMRITFNKDPKDFVQAYFTLDLAMAAIRCNDFV